MRSFILAATVVLGAAALPSTHYNVPFMAATVSATPMQQDPSGAPAPSSSQPAQPAASQPAPAPSPAPDVKVDVHTQSTSWHPNPTWVAIGVIGAVLLIVVLVMASRSGSNTVIRG
jgi:hypothetical protein